MPTQRVRLPGSLGARRGPVDAEHLHWCSETCLHVTANERRIIELVSRGLRNSQIALCTETSPITVKNTLSRLMRKLGVQSRTELAVLALRSGLLPISRS